MKEHKALFLEGLKQWTRRGDTSVQQRREPEVGAGTSSVP
jgi:hypothetical protein